MNGFVPEDDGELLELLGAAIDPDEPVPDDVFRAAADLAFDLHLRGDTGFFETVEDSWAAEQSVGVRGAAAPTRRFLTFAADGVELELELGTEAPGVTGAVRPPGATVHLETRSGARRLEPDAHGRFLGAADEPFFRLRVELGERRLVTTWLRH